MDFECQNFVIFTARFLIGRWSAKDLLQWKSAIYHSIKLGFEGPVAKKFLNGIYYLLPKWQNSCSKMWSIEQLYIELGYLDKMRFIVQYQKYKTHF